MGGAAPSKGTGTTTFGGGKRSPAVGTATRSAKKREGDAKAEAKRTLELGKEGLDALERRIPQRCMLGRPSWVVWWSQEARLVHDEQHVLKGLGYGLELREAAKR